MVLRRSVLLGGFTGLFCSLAGCSRLVSNAVPVEIRVSNNRRDPQDVKLEVEDPDGQRILTHEIEVEATADQDDDFQWATELSVAGSFESGEAYQLTVELLGEDGDNTNTETVSVECDPEETDTGTGGSWGVRLPYGGGINIYDNEIC